MMNASLKDNHKAYINDLADIDQWAEQEHHKVQCERHRKTTLLAERIKSELRIVTRQVRAGS